ncbi:MAG: hypothetical protein CL947_00640, partial [Epsilonproteobacteria bacterium]|nr:hypothetical protein [Campylobacterota bacterium]
MKKIYAYTLFFIAFGTFIFYMSQMQSLKPDHVLIVGTSPDYPPYAYIDVKTGEIIGFDIDVAKEVANRLGKECRIKDMPFSSLIFDLLSEDIDMIAAGLTPTPRKAKNVHFTQLYLQGDPLIALTQASGTPITSVDDLSGKKVVVNTGYTADLYLSDKKGIDLIRLKSPAESFMALKTGSVDVFVAAKSSLVNFLQQKNADKFAMFVLPDTGDDYAIAINKHNDT